MKMRRDRSALVSLCLALLAIVHVSGCTKFAVLDAMIPRGGSTRTSDLAYGSHPRQTLDVYVLRDAKPNADVVIFFYGGNWQTGSKGDYRFVAQALTSSGYIAVLPDYRLYPQVRFPAFVEDGALAVRWVHDHIVERGGDPAHVYLMGHSAGAHIAALLALDPHYLRDVGLDQHAIRAVAALSGPYDFVPGPDDRGVFSKSRDDATTDPNMEPISFAANPAPPMLLIHGVKDEVVSIENARAMLSRMQTSGGQAQLIEYPNRGHEGVVLSLAWPFRNLAPTLTDVHAFFECQRDPRHMDR